MKALFFAILFCSACFAADYVVLYDGRTGKVNCIQRTSDGACIPLDIKNRDYAEFLKWNETAKISMADRAPDPIPPKEAERLRRLSVALTYLKAIPDAWENGTNDQKIMWALKQALKELRDNTD